MKKRNVFNELVQGFDDLKTEREGKISLKSTAFVDPQPIAISAARITAIRERLNYSQSVFAALLRTNVSTLRNWGQDRSRPNAQAASNSTSRLLKFQKHAWSACDILL